MQSVHAYRLSEVLSGGNYVLRFPAASRIRAVGQDMNFDLVNSYYFSSSSSGGGRSYTGSGRMSGKSAAYGGSATNTSTTVPGSNGQQLHAVGQCDGRRYRQSDGAEHRGDAPQCGQQTCGTGECEQQKGQNAEDRSAGKCGGGSFLRSRSRCPSSLPEKEEI
ncbi:hypothetical protein HMPREF9623_00935 [Stomatobaculum longum]|uniref:Uncharacterized protein n=1 Tax=Stomatobaculum longum TaxID=796942 RepID=A0AA37DGL1_9FIRM|nr:hypothetical protein [Stomatobaculum longum]EHO17336.1 hypothetical protein HMPREF9623_00935 [Stomatobaculum longum]